MSDFLAIVLTSAVASLIVSKASTWVIERSVTRLEFNLATLQERLLSEIKRRAGSIPKKHKELEDEILAAAAVSAPRQVNPQPWWIQATERAKG